MVSPQQLKSRPYLRWLLLLPIPALWCVLSSYGRLDFLEHASIDWRFRYRGELEAPVKVVYVDIDSLSLNEIGNQPWDRSYYRRVAEALIAEARVKAVGFDLVFSDAGIAQSADRKRIVEGNADFGRYLLTQPPVALAAAYGGWQFLDVNGQVKERSLPLLAMERRPPDQIEPPEMPSFETSPDPEKRRPFVPPVAVGLIDTLGNGTRIVPAWTPSNVQRTYYHLSLELARLYWGLPPGAIRIEEGAAVFRRADGSVQARVPLVEGQLLEVNWFTRWYSPHVVHAEFSSVEKFARALADPDPELRQAGREFFAQEEFKDAVVLIGPVDPLLQDLAPTSLDERAVPKVSVHGNLLKTIVSGKLLRHPPTWVEYALVLGLTAAMAALSVVGGARALFAKIMAIAVAVLYAAIAFQVFARAHFVLPLVAPLGAAFTTSFAGLLWQVLAEQRAKGRIKGMFGAYVAPELVNQMIESGEDPQLGGHDDEITAYFSDIQGFSRFSETLGPGPLVELMNEYLTACTDIVQAQGGTLDKYIGDAVVAMFGAPLPLPDHAYRACVASQLVQQKLAELRGKWKGEAGRWPEIVGQMQSRIGLNSGVAMIGNMGSRTRFNYTMMGDNVNLASRMESGAKFWGVFTMVTEATRAACERHGGDRVVFRPLGRIVVMGREQPVPIYEIMGLKESLPPTARECRELFEQGLTRYYARDWDGARELFRRSGEREPNQPGKTVGVKTNPSLVYLEIVEECRLAPPAPEWDGRYVMREK